MAENPQIARSGASRHRANQVSFSQTSEHYRWTLLLTGAISTAPTITGPASVWNSPWRMARGARHSNPASSLIDGYERPKRGPARVRRLWAPRGCRKEVGKLVRARARGHRGAESSKVPVRAAVLL